MIKKVVQDFRLEKGMSHNFCFVVLVLFYFAFPPNNCIFQLPLSVKSLKCYDIPAIAAVNSWLLATIFSHAIEL